MTTVFMCGATDHGGWKLDAATDDTRRRRPPDERNSTTVKPPLGHTHPAVCVVFICADGKGNILLGRRGPGARNEHGTWDCGGGAVEHGETAAEAVAREVREEYGTEAVDITFLGARDVIRRDAPGGAVTSHWVSLVHAVRVDRDDVGIGDSGEIEEVGWYTLDALPSPLHSQLAGDLALYAAAW